MKRRKIAILTIVVAIILGFLFLNLRNNQDKQSVTLSPTAGTTIQIGYQDEEGGARLSKVLLSATEQQTIRLDPGVYTIVYSGQGFESQTSSINVVQKTEVKTPALKLSSQKLSQLLSQERVAITAALQKITSTGDGYILNEEKLYMQGEWYAAKLTPGNTIKRDVLRVVAHKEKGVWKAATAPRLVLSKYDYPNVPLEVLRDINNR